MTADRHFRALEQGRANNFDALRVALALLVIVSHSYALLDRGSNAAEPLHRLTGGQMTFGELAVNGFFLVSGYLITQSWQRSRSVVDYLRRRVLRIYPGFLVAIAFSSLLVAPILTGDPAGYWARFDRYQFAVGTARLDAYSADVVANGSLWSIRYEFNCYLALAALGLVGALRARPLVLGATLGCSAVYALQLLRGFQVPGSRLTWLWCYPDFWPRVAACFLAGSAFHLYADRVVRSGALLVGCLAALALAAAFPRPQALPLIFPYAGGYVLLALAFTPAGPLRRIADHGDFSYGLYLYAFPVQQLLVHWAGPRLNPITLSLAASAVTLVFAAASWDLVERPFLTLKRSRFVPPDARPESLGEPAGEVLA